MAKRKTQPSPPRPDRPRGRGNRLAPEGETEVVYVRMPAALAARLDRLAADLGVQGKERAATVRLLVERADPSCKCMRRGG
jgi:hypothetical protein